MPAPLALPIDVDRLTIIRAQPEDAEELKKIAIAAKGHWGYAAHLMAQWAQTPIITPAAIAADGVYKMCNGVSIIAWHRLMPSVPTAILDDLWVLPLWIGHGIGRRLFQHTVEQAQAAGALAIELDADPNATPFYVRMGCQIVGESWTEWGRTIPRLRYNLPANMAHIS